MNCITAEGAHGEWLLLVMVSTWRDMTSSSQRPHCLLLGTSAWRYLDLARGLVECAPKISPSPEQRQVVRAALSSVTRNRQAPAAQLGGLPLELGGQRECPHQVHR
ncbi:hypothetical protein LIA77_03573 [Sarocladium implicatum]|nr:hypothetical protein LIA77_03573 [Sarocladium implicatum]